MSLVRTAFILLALGWARAACAQELPAKGGTDLQKESAELIDGLPNLSQMPPPEAPAPAALLSMAAEQARLEGARRKQERWEKLARQGVLSQSEAEQCQLEVAVDLVRCERAKLNQAQSELEAAQRQKSDPALIQAATAALESSKALTADAESQLNRTRLRLAQLHLDRSRRLYAERLMTRSQLERAQSQVAKLQEQAPPPTP